MSWMMPYLRYIGMLSWTVPANVTGVVRAYVCTPDKLPGCTKNVCPLAELVDAGISNNSPRVAYQLYQRMLLLMHRQDPDSLDWTSGEKGIAGVFTRQS